MHAARMRSTQYVTFVNLVVLITLLVATPSDAPAQTGWGDSSFATPYNDQDGRWTGSNWLGGSNSNTGWTVGVIGDNTDAGVRVRQVAPDSAAARANVAPGDVIVCVGGDQVGHVGRQVFDLREKLNQHADSRGRVLSLVHSPRLGQLRPVSLQLQTQQAGLIGSLTVQGGRLPMDSVVTVRLENVGRPYYTVRNGEYSFRADGFGVGDIPFQLNYDPRYISNSDTYRLRAFITSGGRVIYDTIRPPLVLTQGNSSSARLVLRPTSYGPGRPTQYTDVGYTPIDAYQQDINAAYLQYLNRQPSSMEMAAWYHSGDISDRLQRIAVELIATQEYFNRFGGSNSRWLQQAFTEIIGHRPSATETELWMRRFAELGYSRTELLNQLFMQAGR